MSDIFLSYAREDSAVAQRLANALEGEGWAVWWDSYIPPGKTFAKVIEEKIGAARCVVVLWSKNSVASEWVMLEARTGRERGVLIPAALIENMKLLPLEFRWIQTASLVGWKGDRSHQGYRSLVDAISCSIGRSQPKASPRPQSSPQPQPSPRPQSSPQPQPSPPQSSPRPQFSPRPQPSPQPQLSPQPQPSPRAHPPAKWKIVGAGAAIALMLGIGIYIVANGPPPPTTVGAFRPDITIGDYGVHYQVYRNNEPLGSTPYTFKADFGENIQVECRREERVIETLNFKVGTNNVWSCRE